MAMIRRKYFFVAPRLRHNIAGLFKKFENCKNFGVLMLLVVGIFFVSVFHWQYYFNIETKSQTFIDILHNIPVKQRKSNDTTYLLNFRPCTKKNSKTNFNIM